MEDIRVYSKSVVEPYDYKEVKVLNNLGPWVLNDSMFPFPYYLSGVEEFDENFNNYIQKGLHTLLTATKRI